MKLAEVKPLIDKICFEFVMNTASNPGGRMTNGQEQELRLALETAFVAGVRSGLKYTSNAKFAEVFGGKAGK